MLERLPPWGNFAVFAIAVAVVWMAVERRDRTLFRMDFDSLAAIGVYLGGITVLYQLR